MDRPEESKLEDLDLMDVGVEMSSLEGRLCFKLKIEYKVSIRI